MGQAPVGVAVLSSSLEFLYVNEALAAINGRPVDEHVGQTPREALGPNSDAWLGHVRTALEDGVVVGPVRVVALPGASHRAFEGTFWPVDEPGRERVIVALVQEVTDAVDALQRLEVLAAAAQALTAALTLEEVGLAITSTVTRSFVDRVAFVTVDDGGARIIDMGGYPDDLVAEWKGRLVPLVEDDPLTECLRTGQPVVISAKEVFDERYPRLAELRHRAGDEATITAPITIGGVVVAALHVTWSGSRRMGSHAVETTTTLATIARLALKRVRLTEQLQLDRFRGALNAMIDSVTICSSVRGETDEIVDFRVEFVKDDFKDRFGRTAGDVLGRRVLETYPSWKESGMFDRFRHVVDTGEPILDDRLDYEERDEHGRVTSGSWRVQVVRLGDGFLSTSRDITEQLAAEQELAAARRGREAERQTMRLLQRLSLPTELPSLRGVTLAAQYEAADQEVPLGGDWYDAITTADGRLVLIVGDVAGHGRAAATTMIRLRNITNAFASTLASPAAVLTATAASLGSDPGLMATCLVVEYEPATARLTACRAGHLPPLVATADAAELWELSAGLPLGVASDRPYEDARRTVSEPSTVLLYTDGLIERRDRSLDTAFAELVKRVETSRFWHQPTALCRELIDGVALDPHDDDYCIVTVALDPTSVVR